MTAGNPNLVPGCAPNKKSVPSYKSMKDELLKLYIERKKRSEIAVALKISSNTVTKYMNMLIDELGNLTTARAKQLKEDFVVKSIAELDMAKRVPLSKLKDGDSKIALNAVNTLIGLIRTETEVLSRLKVIDSGNVQNINITNTGIPSVEKLAQIYAENIKNGKTSTNK